MGALTTRIRNENSTENGVPLPVRDRSLQHDAYALIVEWIHQGKLRPGDRLSEAAIASSLGVSRGPVREAIQRLDSEGLVARRPRRGAVIPEFSRKEVEDIIDARQLIEGHVARRASQTITSDDVLELERLIGSMRSAAEIEQWTQTALVNASFHEAVVRISDSKVLHRMWKTLHPLTWLLAHTVPPNKPHDAESLLIRHQQLLDALQSGDADIAEETFRQHIFNASPLI